MKNKTIIYFIRHAESDHDIKEDRVRPLTKNGELKSIEIVELFKNENIDKIYSSPYKRAKDTIIHISKYYKKDIVEIEDFKERKITDRWIEDFNKYSKMQWEDFNYKIEGGESLKEVQDRNIISLKENNGKNIIIGTHGTALSTIINYFDKFDYKDFERIKEKLPWIVKMEFDGEDYIGYSEIN